MGKLAGKVAIVTGASKGIGAGIAKALAAEGASIVVNYATSKAGAEAVVAAIVSTGGAAIAIKSDVSHADDAQELVGAAIAHFGRLDILVNNSGIYEFAPLEKVTEEAFHKSFNINVLGLLLVTQAAVQHMGEGASIINIGSAASRHNAPGTVVYTATKSAVNAVTLVLAKEFGPKRIRINAINPGFVLTEGTEGYRGSDLEKSLVDSTPLGRAGQPSDIATVAVFLASDDAGWLTGELVFASGGS